MANSAEEWTFWKNTESPTSASLVKGQPCCTCTVPVQSQRRPHDQHYITCMSTRYWEMVNNRRYVMAGSHSWCTVSASFSTEPFIQQREITWPLWTSWQWPYISCQSCKCTTSLVRFSSSCCKDFPTFHVGFRSSGSLSSCWFFYSDATYTWQPQNSVLVFRDLNVDKGIIIWDITKYRMCINMYVL